MTETNTTNITPNKDRLRLWVAALRSGEFKQGRRALAYETVDGSSANCCLGVACEMYRRETGIGEWKKENAAINFLIPSRGQSYGALPPEEVGLWFGVVDLNLMLANGKCPTHMNDNEGASFSDIADQIEITFGLK